MRTKLRDLITSEYFITILFFLSLLFLMLPLQLAIGSDDEWNSQRLAEQGFWEFLGWFNDWQPRVVNNFLYLLFGFHFWPWKICNAGVVSLTLLFISKMNSINSLRPLKQNTAAFAYVSFYYMYPAVISASVFWYTGSFQYAWPALFLFVALVPFYYALCGSTIPSRLFQCLAVFFAGLAAYTEQAAAVLLCFALITLVILRINQEHIPMYLIAEIFFSVINLFVYFMLGGQSTRAVAELHYYPNFDMITTFEKIFQGVNWGNYQLFNSSNILFFTLVILVGGIYVVKEKGYLYRMVALFPAFLLSLNIFPLDILLQKTAYNETNGTNLGIYLSELISYLFRTNAEVPGDVTDFSLGIAQLLPSIWGLAFVLYIGIIILFAFRKYREGIANALLYFAALASSYSLGLSPVIYAAGNRIFYITNLLIICVIANLVKELCMISSKFQSKIRIGLAISMAVALMFFLEHMYVNYMGGVRY